MARKIEYIGDKVGNFRLLGFATGSYICTCSNCGFEFYGDKRARQCLECAIKIVEEKLKSPNTAMLKLPEYKNVESEFNKWWHKEGHGVNKITYKNMHKFFDIVVRQQQHS